MTTTLERLPPMCAANHPTDNRPIIIKRGESGFYDCLRPDFDVASFNARHGVTVAQREAMEIGSMFGWHVPGVELALIGK